jgi:Tfp pilus assembly protein PilN
MRAVNLLPPDERRKGLEESARKPLLLAGGGIAVVTVLATLVAVLASLEASDTRSRLDAVEAEIAALPEPQVPALDASTLAQERTDRVSALAAALTGRVAFDRLLRQVSLVLPEDAWLTRLDAAAPIPTAPATPGSGAGAASADSAPGVTIEGATWSHDRVAVVLARLSAIPTLQDVRLTGTTRVAPQGSSAGGDEEPQPGKPFVTFVVSADVSTGDES